MKRYQLIDPSPEYPGECCIEEFPAGEWVKYEPWMDEIEKQRKDPNTGLPLVSAKELNEEFKAVQEKCNEPTICAKCKYYELKNNDPKYGISIIEHICHCKTINYITGEPIKKNCCLTKNHGNCSDYKERSDPNV